MIKTPGFTTVFTYIFAANADDYLRFLQEGLGGKLQNLHRAPDGGVANAQIVFGDTTIMISDAAGWSGPTHATY